MTSSSTESDPTRTHSGIAYISTSRTPYVLCVVPRLTRCITMYHPPYFYGGMPMMLPAPVMAVAVVEVRPVWANKSQLMHRFAGDVAAYRGLLQGLQVT